MHLRARQALDALGPSHVPELAVSPSLLPTTVSRPSDRLTAAGPVSPDVGDCGADRT